jgi:long-subunit acyl-CoA synthetase (AMP-forming)
VLGPGLVIVPLYVDDDPDSVAWCVDNAAARLLIVENSRIATALAACAHATHPRPPLLALKLKRPLLLQRLAPQIEAAYRDSPPGS